MTISNKLSYLNDTKTLLRESINQAGGSITEETPFREYPSWVNYVVWLNSGGLKTLFSEGEEGVLWGDLPYFVDVDGNTPATWGDPVGLVKDSSGNGNDFTQPTVTARPILRESGTGIAYLDFDGTDDLIFAELPDISSGTLVIAGTNGFWIDDDYNFAGGTFSIGPTSYTNGLEGILTAIGDPIVGGFLVINRQLTPRERDLVIHELKERGAPDFIINFGKFDILMNKVWPEA